MEQNSGGRKGGIIVKTAQPGRGGLLGPGRKRAGLRPRQLGRSLHESPAAGSLGGGLRGQGHAAGVSVGPSRGRGHGGRPEPESALWEAGWEGWPHVSPSGRPASRLAGAGGFGDPHPETSPHSCSWAEPLHGLTCSGTPDPGPNHQHTALPTGAGPGELVGWGWGGTAYRVSCSGSSGDWPPLSSSWARSCRSLSRRRRSRAASSSSSTLH